MVTCWLVAPKASNFSRLWWPSKMEAEEYRSEQPIRCLGKLTRKVLLPNSQCLEKPHVAASFCPFKNSHVIVLLQQLVSSQTRNQPSVSLSFQSYSFAKLVIILKYICKKIREDTTPVIKYTSPYIYARNSRVQTLQPG